MYWSTRRNVTIFIPRTAAAFEKKTKGAYLCSFSCDKSSKFCFPTKFIIFCLLEGCLGWKRCRQNFKLKDCILKWLVVFIFIFNFEIEFLMYKTPWTNTAGVMHIVACFDVWTQAVWACITHWATGYAEKRCIFWSWCNINGSFSKADAKSMGRF